MSATGNRLSDGLPRDGERIWQEAVAAKGGSSRGFTDEENAKLVAALLSGASVGEAVRRLKDTP